MADTNNPRIVSDQSDRSDPFGILALFRSDLPCGQSDHDAAPDPSGPTGPTANDLCRTKIDKKNQSGPTGPTGPMEVLSCAVAPSLSDTEALDLLDFYEERTSIREFDGGQPRVDAEAGALVDTAKRTAVAPHLLQRLWAEHPDAVAYLAHLSKAGPMTCSGMAYSLQWDLKRAWQAEARLRVSGLVTIDSRGRGEMRTGKGLK